MLHALLLAAAASCPDRDGGATAWPAPILPPALSAPYPDGVHLSIKVQSDEHGKVLSVRSDAPSAALGAVAQAWGQALTISPPQHGCANVAGTTTFEIRFFPAPSGVAALPPVVGGVNFNELTYTPGPCYASEPAPMHLGGYEYFSKSASTDLEASVENVFAGTVGGRQFAVVQLRCDFPVGFNDEALLYEVRGAKATMLRTLGTFVLPAPDDAYVDGGWLRVSFAGDHLYVDAWQFFDACKPNADWIVTAYSLESGALVERSKTAHHRASVAIACEP